MREILFRGKDVETGKWKFGSFYYGLMVQFLLGDKKHFIIDGDTSLYYEVIPETIGQYTGIDDTNGNKIFDGDVLNVEGIKAIMKWQEGRKWEFVSVNKNELEGYLTNDELDNISQILWDCSFAIIGNIHDNPELLEEVK